MTVSKRGFTLIELVIVMALVGILLAVALPQYISWRKGAAYNNAAYQVMGALRQARSQAVSEKREHRVEFDVSAGRYQLTRKDPITNLYEIVQNETGFPPEVKLRANADCAGTADVNFTFASDGTGSSDGATNDICIMADPGDGSPLEGRYQVSIPSATSGRATLDRL